MKKDIVVGLGDIGRKIASTSRAMEMEVFAVKQKINIAPKFRLFIMIIFLLFLIIYNKFTIERISLDYLNNLMRIDIFSLFFVCLCFLFIINGANLIDGFNGLLSIHSFIILVILK